MMMKNKIQVRLTFTFLLLHVLQPSRDLVWPRRPALLRARWCDPDLDRSLGLGLGWGDWDLVLMFGNPENN